MIYFMKLGEAEDSPIKIGYADDVHQRMFGVRHQRKARVTLLGILPGARPEEAEMHRRWAYLRPGRSEDFIPAPELMDFIRDHATPLVADDSLATAKIDAELLRKAKHIATFEEKTLAEFLTEVLTPIVDRKLRLMAGEMVDKPAPKR